MSPVSAIHHSGWFRQKLFPSQFMAGLALVWSLPSTAVAQPVQSAQPLESILRLGSAHLQIGTDLVEGPTLFGSILAVALDGQRNVYVLDGTDHTVRRFDTQGRHLASAGGPGRGPGDLRDPLTLWHDGVSSLYVVDRYDGISLFTTSGTGIRYRTRFGAALRASSLCGLNNVLVVSGYQEGHLLHVISPTGSTIRSFGARFRVDTIPGIQSVHDRAEMHVACDEPHTRVYVAEASQALVRGYDISGRLLWQTALPDYSGYTVRVNRDPPGIAVFGGAYQTKTLTRLGTDLLLVQARREGRRRNPASGTLIIEELGIITYILSAARGTVLTVTSSLPLLETERGDEVGGHTQDPFPSVLLFRRLSP